jgi:hypothetical protein
MTAADTLLPGAVDRGRLTRTLLRPMEQAYGSEGTPGLRRMVAELLERLDDPSVVAYAHSLGVEDRPVAVTA